MLCLINIFTLLLHLQHFAMFCVVNWRKVLNKLSTFNGELIFSKQNIMKLESMIICKSPSICGVLYQSLLFGII